MENDRKISEYDEALNFEYGSEPITPMPPSPCFSDSSSSSSSNESSSSDEDIQPPTATHAAEPAVEAGKSHALLPTPPSTSSSRVDTVPIPVSKPSPKVPVAASAARQPIIPVVAGESSKLSFKATTSPKMPVAAQASPDRRSKRRFCEKEDAAASKGLSMKKPKIQPYIRPGSTIVPVAAFEERNSPFVRRPTRPQRPSSKVVIPTSSSRHYHPPQKIARIAAKSKSPVGRNNSRSDRQQQDGKDKDSKQKDDEKKEGTHDESPKDKYPQKPLQETSSSERHVEPSQMMIPPPTPQRPFSACCGDKTQYTRLQMQKRIVDLECENKNLLRSLNEKSELVRVLLENRRQFAKIEQLQREVAWNNHNGW